MASPPAAPVVPHTLTEALAATYSNQPALQAERAKLRATDENVPTALAGWRPTVVLAGTAGLWRRRVAAVSAQPVSGRMLQRPDRPADRAPPRRTVTQTIYSGGKVQANVNRSKNQVMAERATLIAQEQTSFNNAVSAYVGVIQAKQLLALQINNEQVLAKQLAGDQRPLPRRRNHPHRRGAGRSRAGRRAGNARNRGRQPADRARHVPAVRRCVAARRPGRAAAAEPAGQERAGSGDAGRDQQPQRHHRPVQRCGGEGCGRRGVRRAAAAGQPAGTDVPAEQLGRPQHARTTATR